MAESPRPNDKDKSDDAGKIPNTPARSALIAKLDTDLVPIELQIEALNAKRREKRLVFKADTGIALADFDAARRIAGMDDEERRTKLDNFMDCFNGLKAGEQMNWVDIADQGAGAHDIHTTTSEAPDEAVPGYTAQTGRAAFGNGESLDDNPHKAGSAAATAWEGGFISARTDADDDEEEPVAAGQGVGGTEATA